MASHDFSFIFYITLFLLFHGNINATYDQVVSPGFSYSGTNDGPGKWGNINPAYVKCRTGKTQSPVDIVVNQAVINKSLTSLSTDYFPVNATLINHKFIIELRLGNAGKFNLNGKDYTLTQMHWHTPSEHRINGVQYGAEAHMVHVAADGSRAVIGILYKIGKADPLVARMQNKLVELANEQGGDIGVGKFNTKKLGRKTRKYYRYVGSLTTPPCIEDINWTILGKVRSISKEQINLLEAPLETTCKTNCRPLQPLNSRHVEMYDELV
ncbi:alpha carbonic anhydrase 1, chloroplastic-like [Impatiens glandulifera]|uniref:alpha carbonic anhydrase 1, chloroplastic-like n=1 Tax=Impatiens glandulifera TaxID=253017 RepID=UPI001FB1A1DA|nr:alpha carbonic anhydrase 1, chloroplastic-like [Impatiens glandulifera]